MERTTSVTCRCPWRARVRQQNRCRRHRRHFKRQLINKCQIFRRRLRLRLRARQTFSFTRMSRCSREEIWFLWIASTTTAATTWTSRTRTSTWSTSIDWWRKATRRRTSSPLWASRATISRWPATSCTSSSAPTTSRRPGRSARTTVELEVFLRLQLVKKAYRFNCLSLLLRKFSFSTSLDELWVPTVVKTFLSNRMQSFTA